MIRGSTLQILKLSATKTSVALQLLKIVQFLKHTNHIQGSEKAHFAKFNQKFRRYPDDSGDLDSPNLSEEIVAL